MSGKPILITRLIAVVLVAAAPLAQQGCAIVQGRDPLQVTVLGIEQLQSTVNVSLREGSDAIVRFCLPSGSDLSDGWIGVFPAGTPLNNMTKKAARTIGIWLYTPGGGTTPPGGEAEAYTSELPPGTTYHVLLFASSGTQRVGRPAEFTLTPVLPQ